MLISHIHKFIYLKPKKVAGTSTEVFFKKFCIDPKLIPQFESELELNESSVTFKFPTTSKFGLITNGRDLYKETGIWISHMTSKDIKKEIGNNIWDSYTKIANVRNPWDIAVSMFHWRIKNYPIWEQRGFEAFVKNKNIQNNLVNNRNIWSLNNKFTFEYIRFENMEEDILKICSKLGLKVKNMNLGHYKKVLNRKPYQDYYNEETKNIIRKLFIPEINYFGYKF